jgi:hypothetical protein
MDKTGTDAKTVQNLLTWPLETYMRQLAALVPRNVTEPILPGWNFGTIYVNEQNSRSPETERAIVSEASYGRQLGRLMDAVAVLIDERSPDLPRPKALDELIELRDRIAEVKKRTAESRLKRIESDLDALKRERPDDYRALVARFSQESKA